MTYKILGSVRLSEVWLGYVSESSKVVGLQVRIPVKKYSFFSCLKKCEFYLLCRTTPSFLPFFYFLPHLFCGSESIRRERETSVHWLWGDRKLALLSNVDLAKWGSTSRPERHSPPWWLFGHTELPYQPKCSHLLSIKKFLLLKTP